MHYSPGGGGWLATSSGDSNAETLDRVQILSLCGERKAPQLRLLPPLPEAENAQNSPALQGLLRPPVRRRSTAHLPPRCGEDPRAASAPRGAGNAGVPSCSKPKAVAKPQVHRQKANAERNLPDGGPVPRRPFKPQVSRMKRPALILVGSADLSQSTSHVAWRPPGCLLPPLRVGACPP